MKENYFPLYIKMFSFIQRFKENVLAKVLHERFILPVILCFNLRLFSVLGLSWGCSSIQCKAGWQEWNEACYKLSTEQKEFSDASASCKNDSANLVSIHSAQENEFVRTLTGGKDVFVGLSDSDIEATFVWIDGSTVSYTNWGDGEPNDDFGMSDCVILLGTTGKWNDTPCAMWYEYVCKFTNTQPSREKGN